MLFHNSKTQLLLVNSLTFGLEVCLAAGITYVPPLLLEVGVEEKFMTMVLGRQFFSHLRSACFPFESGGQIRAWGLVSEECLYCHLKGSLFLEEGAVSQRSMLSS